MNTSPLGINHRGETITLNVPWGATAGETTPSTAACRVLSVGNDALVWSERWGASHEPAVFKMYHHRGLISWWREHTFRFRVQREYETLSWLVKHDVPCSPPLFWTHGLCDEYGHYEILATREIPDAMPAGDFLRMLTSSTLATKFGPMFRLLHDMHKCGVYHGRLDLRNILVCLCDAPEPTFYVIDTPQAIIFPHALFQTRVARHDLLHVLKPLVKAFGPDCCKPLLRSYGFDDVSVQRYLHQIRTWRSSRALRNGLRAEFGLRAAYARCRARAVNP